MRPAAPGPGVAPARALTHALTHALALALAVSLGAASPAADAADVNVVGISPGRAIVSIDGGAPRVMSLNAEVGGVKLLATGTDEATFLIDGRRQTLHLGQFYGGSAQSGRARTVLTQDNSGHYFVQGSVNGSSVRFLVDTGATFVVLSGDDAHRMGISYSDAPRGISNTANGPVPVYRVTLNTVKVGDITLNNVEGMVQENLGTISLLGMSFLSRTEMSRDGDSMILTKRF